MDKRLRGLTSRKIKQILKHWGFVLVRQAGSHEQWEKTEGNKTYLVTVVATRLDYPRGTLHKIFDQSGHSEKEWVAALDNI